MDNNLALSLLFTQKRVELCENCRELLSIDGQAAEQHLKSGLYNYSKIVRIAIRISIYSSIQNGRYTKTGSLSNFYLSDRKCHSLTN